MDTHTLLPHLQTALRILAHVLAWLVALTWLYKAIEATFGLPRIPNLLLPAYDLTPTGNPTLTVIVPARNEAADIAACLQSLIAQDYPNLTVLAVDDRSTDATGDLMDTLAAQHPHRLRILHVTELPPGWLGKTHAMALAARHAPSDFLLFTDGDVVFRPDALRRSLAYAIAARADHLVTVPTPTVHRWDEAALLGFFQIFGLWGIRPWRVADPKSRLDAIGIGAFNLIRRDAYLAIGGFEALRLQVIEDIGLGRRVKAAGLAQRMAFGRGLVNVHWATGAIGLSRVMTKNLFSAFRFYISLALLACVWLAVFCAAPGVALFLPGFRLPAVLTLAAMALCYRFLSPSSGISTWNALLAPFAAILFIYTLLHSMITTLRQGGITWRGTFYPLAELRKNAAPLF
jgi:glycosyltransferase involved in cell wall biosynthesis